MVRWVGWRLIGVLTLLCLSACDAPSPQYQAALQEAPYRADADPQADLTQARALAAQTGRRVLVVFGANWCPQCRALAADFKAGRFVELGQRDFVVVKVDVGNFDHNQAFTRRFGAPTSRGIPALAVVTPKDEIIHVAHAEEVARELHRRDSTVREYFAALMRMTPR